MGARRAGCAGAASPGAACPGPLGVAELGGPWGWGAGSLPPLSRAVPELERNMVSSLERRLCPQIITGTPCCAPRKAQVELEEKKKELFDPGRFPPAKAASLLG